MTFSRFSLIAAHVAAVMVLIIGAPIRAQDSNAPAAQTASANSSGPSAPANSQQAYALPPDILAKAVAIGRIRNFENLAGSVWGIAFLWILLAARGWLGIERWARRISSKLSRLWRSQRNLLWVCAQA